jgi:hypothetical protein
MKQDNNNSHFHTPTNERITSTKILLHMEQNHMTKQKHFKREFSAEIKL